jgi:hypothetical protein
VHTREHTPLLGGSLGAWIRLCVRAGAHGGCGRGNILTIVTFRNALVTFCNSQEFQILSRSLDLDTGLWRINLRQDNQHVHQAISKNVYELRSTGALVCYLNNVLFIPTKSALLQAVNNGHLVTWPGLTEDATHKHLKLTPATAMGHTNQRLQNIRSTSKTPIKEVLTTNEKRTTIQG